MDRPGNVLMHYPAPEDGGAGPAPRNSAYHFYLHFYGTGLQDSLPHGRPT